MRKSGKVILLMAAGLAVMVAGGLGIFSMLLAGSCATDPLSEEKSPDGKWKAVIFTVDCGATTTDKEVAPRVSLLRATDRLSKSDSGNIFGVSPVAGIGHPKVNVSWSSPNELTVRYQAGARVFKNESRYRDVAIKYVAEP